MSKDWEVKTLGEVCEIIKRGIAPKYTEQNGITIINQKCIRNHTINLTFSRLHNVQLKKVSEEKFIKIGDVLINSTGTGTLGRVAQVRDKKLESCTVDTHVTIVRPKSHLFYMDFFGYALIKIENEIEKAGEGASGQTELARTKLQNEFEISYPTCKNEQKQIVEILDTAFEALEKAKKNIETNLKNTKELFDSKLNEIFSQKGEGWEEKKLIDIADVIDSLHKTPKYVDDGYPMIRVTDIKGEKLEFKNTKKVDEETYLEFSKRHIPNIGDIVFSRVGSYGRSSIVTTADRFCLGQNTVFILPHINSYYFYFFLNSPNFTIQVDRLVSGTTQPTVSLKSIKAINIPYPNIIEQEKLVVLFKLLLEQTKQLEQKYQKKLDNLEELKKSLLQKAFSGELTK